MSRSINVEIDRHKCPIKGFPCFAVGEERRYLAGSRRRSVLSCGGYGENNCFRFLSVYHRNGGVVVDGNIQLDPATPVDQAKGSWRGRGGWLYQLSTDWKLFGVSAREVDAAVHPLPSLKTLSAAAWLRHHYEAQHHNNNNNNDERGGEGGEDGGEDGEGGGADAVMRCPLNLDDLPYPIPAEIKEFLMQVHAELAKGYVSIIKSDPSRKRRRNSAEEKKTI